MLLLLFAGYYLQLTYQHLLAMLSLMLFTGLARPFRPLPLVYSTRPVQNAGTADAGGGGVVGERTGIGAVTPTTPDTRVHAEGQ
jgi:hypothetical protein